MGLLSLVGNGAALPNWKNTVLIFDADASISHTPNSAFIPQSRQGYCASLVEIVLQCGERI
ncbi:uncharacterized protein RCO7_14726 [Rhynchosporium graminicola]|uniref:Uncharacterized protein n=1 Tax=Rhynchosporium graminicola TaxID=2792576 RepID=A0A1E1KYQ5_9HELO|nr:uncharacterized protein RCO7_14726 [Rhynchosporium commune]